jgi:hypothetical protein
MEIPTQGSKWSHHDGNVGVLSKQEFNSEDPEIPGSITENSLDQLSWSDVFVAVVFFILTSAVFAAFLSLTVNLLTRQYRKK